MPARHAVASLMHGVAGVAEDTALHACGVHRSAQPGALAGDHWFALAPKHGYNNSSNFGSLLRQRQCLFKAIFHAQSQAGWSCTSFVREQRPSCPHFHFRTGAASPRFNSCAHLVVDTLRGCTEYNPAYAHSANPNFGHLKLGTCAGHLQACKASVHHPGMGTCCSACCADDAAHDVRQHRKQKGSASARRGQNGSVRSKTSSRREARPLPGSSSRPGLEDDAHSLTASLYSAGGLTLPRQWGTTGAVMHRRCLCGAYSTCTSLPQTWMISTRARTPSLTLVRGCGRMGIAQ